MAEVKRHLKPVIDSRIDRIRRCEDKANQLDEAGSWYRWTAAWLMVEETEAGQSQRKLATEIGKDHRHVGRCIRVWRERSGDLGPHLIELIQKPRSEAQGPPASSELTRLPNFQKLYAAVRDHTGEEEQDVAEASEESPAITPIGGIRTPAPDPLPVPTEGTQRRTLLNLIEEAAERYDGQTDDELINLSGIRHSSENARRKELEDQGWIMETGMWRETSSGSKALIWFLTPQGAKQFGLANYDVKVMTSAAPAGVEPKKRRSASASTPAPTHRTTTKTLNKRSAAQQAELERRAELQVWRGLIAGLTTRLSTKTPPDPAQLAAELDDGGSYFTKWDLQLTIKWLRSFCDAWPHDQNPAQRGEW